MEATWTHLRTTPAPFGELTWTRARQILAGRGSDPVTEAEIAAAAARLLDVAEAGPGQPGQPGRQAAVLARDRRAAGRARATARDRPVPALSGHQPDPDPGPAQEQAEDPAEEVAEVIALPLFDARKEAEKWW